MKKPRSIWRGIVLILSFILAFHARALTTDGPAAGDWEVMLQAVEATAPLPASVVTNSGNFYSAQHAPGSAEEWPPLPGNVLGLDIWPLGAGFYLLDDRAVDYSASSVRSLSRGGMQMMSLDPGDPGDGDGGTNTYESSFTPLVFTTNELWLEITNVADGLAYLNLMNATNQVYKIWSKTDLTLTNWSIEMGLWPTNPVVMPFTVPTLDRTNLFVWARDWTGVTSGGNTTPEWWFWQYFRTVDLSDTNVDSQGTNTLLYDYTNSLDPNVIVFNIFVTNNYVNTGIANLQLNVFGGIPAYSAMLINDTNQADGLWEPYTSPNLVASLGADGAYEVLVGLRGFATNSTETWASVKLTKDTVAPALTLTNPVSNTVSQPLVQVQGFASKPLSRLSYDISNALETLTNQPGCVVSQYYDADLLAFTTNWFQCYDVPLTNGMNSVTLHAFDLAGNETITNLNYTLDYSGDTNPPVLSVVWPQAGMSLAGTSLTLQAQVDDDSARVAATITAANGNTNMVPGIVENSGAVWVNNLPLSPGTNTVTVTATDAAGNVNSTNFNVVQSPVLVTMNGLSADQLNQTTVNVSGTVNITNSILTVNGAAATVNLDGTWTAVNVPASPSGTATFDIVASSGGDSASRRQVWAQPAVVLVANVSGFENYSWTLPDSWGATNGLIKEVMDWDSQNGGENYWTGHFSLDFYYTLSGGPDYPPAVYGALNDTWFKFPLGSAECASLDGNPERKIRTKVVIASPGQMPAATMQTYVVCARAAMVSRPPLPDDVDLVHDLDNPNDQSFDVTIGDAPDYLPDGSWYSGDAPIPPEWMQIQQQTLLNTGITSSDGSVWGATVVSATAGGPPEVTPTVTHNLARNDYTFDVQLGHLAIMDASSGVDLTTRTNTVIVGQQMNFTCQIMFSNQIVTNFPLANFHWSVPGYAISNYVVAADSSSAMVVTNFPTTRSNAVFYWVDGGLKQVQISATVKGQPVTGTAWFNVTNPLPQFSAQILEPVAADTNYYQGGQPAGGPWLHFGINSNANNVGIAFSMDGVPTHDGFFTYGKYFITQLIETHIKRNITSGTNIFGEQFDANGLDTHTNLNDHVSILVASDSWFDSPASPLGGDIRWLSRNDSFTNYLLFQSFTSNSIPVPMYSIVWHWSGSAKTNGIPDGSILLSASTPSAAISQTIVFPQWTNVIAYPTSFQQTNLPSFDEN